MTTAQTHKSDGIGKDIVVYVCLLALAGLQFVIAYQNIEASQMFVRMLAVAMVEAGLGGFFLLHLFAEKRGVFLFFLILYLFFLSGGQHMCGAPTPVVGGAPGLRIFFFGGQ